ncbi:uncharacterized protein HaLaN_24871 [Haematococcus lacustris]|uniref:Peptidase C1A papain C-terminal domain-containing protein n=1 Tax=Haematococcus lacustris TaxID=44745 RepID=A0A699ZVI8_HAELA|nr:uncharacterized protein HaLaN_24871 [Haematococcus lacustris]
MLKIICAVLGAALAAQAAQVPHLQHSQLLDLAEVNPQQAFSVWIAQTSAGRHYAHTPDSEEYRSRFSVWQQNAAYIRKHQASGSSMQLQLNEYADQTWEEFSSKKLGLLGEKALTEKAARTSKSNGGFRYASVKAPPSIDWREKNAVTPVKNQGQCGSCWSFATTGAIEGVNAIYTGELVQLSEQQLVDCDTAKDMGCSGGLMDYAYEYVIANGGIDTEEDYMYWSSWGMSFWTCNRKKESRRTAVTIDGYEDVPTVSHTARPGRRCRKHVIQQSVRHVVLRHDMVALRAALSRIALYKHDPKPAIDCCAVVSSQLRVALTSRLGQVAGCM